MPKDDKKKKSNKGYRKWYHFWHRVGKDMERK
jgi:hypothetical protein